MPISAKIILDSVNVAGERLTTFELTYPRFIHSEFMTHRMFSRNAASSRAIPIEKMIKAVEEDPAMPVEWGRNRKGMQATELLEDVTEAREAWLKARDNAVAKASELVALGVHKQIVNRLLEPWAHITVICSATTYANFFKLRCHADAQPEIRGLAEKMRELYFANSPIRRMWHLPLLEDSLDSLSYADLRRISVGRCARVSYLTHDGKRDPAEDIALHDRLMQSGHWSPFEHVACAYAGVQSGNFRGWRQYREMVEVKK